MVKQVHQVEQATLEKEVNLEPLDQVDLKETKVLQDFPDSPGLPGNKDQWDFLGNKVHRVIREQ